MLIKPWQEASESPAITNTDIQIWSALPESEDSSRYTYLLTEEERNRAERLKSKKVSDLQVISRGILRILLGKYLQEKPHAVEIYTDQLGKPHLKNRPGFPMDFNLAHSDNIILFAFGLGKKIGIDVEKIEPARDIAGISSIVFSSDEKLTLSKSNDVIRDFYTLWTAKEAILKVSGRGFSYPSNQFSVVLSKGIPTVTELPAELSGSCLCSLLSFTPAPGYSAAVATLQ